MSTNHVRFGKYPFLACACTWPGKADIGLHAPIFASQGVTLVTDCLVHAIETHIMAPMHDAG